MGSFLVNNVSRLFNFFGWTKCCCEKNYFFRAKSCLTTSTATWSTIWRISASRPRSSRSGSMIAISSILRPRHWIQIKKPILYNPNTSSKRKKMFIVQFLFTSSTMLRVITPWVNFFLYRYRPQMWVPIGQTLVKLYDDISFLRPGRNQSYLYYWLTKNKLFVVGSLE